MENIPIRHIQATQPQPAFPDSFSIRDIETLLAGKDMVQALHRHDFFLVIALNKGLGSHEIDFTSYAICDQSVFFLRPGQVHKLTLEAASTGYIMQFRGNFYHPHEKASDQLMRKAGNQNFYQFDACKFQNILSILKYIFEEYTDKQEKYQEVIQANLDILFIELIRHSSKSASGNTSLYMQQRLEKFLELIETHMASHKQVSHYARMMNLSTYQLNAITKTSLGKTSSQLIDDSLILEAKRYLLATSNQVNQIAYDLGYEDISYFSRFFKKHTGYSPETFRQNFR
ncbi:helix-turn-helix domain-containing protein [Rhodocytophaga rosea]|uniref:Helix-turn-helix domain-containing protein n=1 Tax=Rhodocytophaga rosea TaxID=2704465 RepID=A0A6C0GHQ7_9BACT|nr:helix-turn-helix domain-containing protein [Rhodocytophaga rosea]QHT67222.1 helix-turn-helix domain-containing protein [Rhodocytophaga rosea]